MSQEHGYAPSGTDRLSPRRIAVLPFRTIGPEKSGDHFAEGLTEEIISSISNLRELSVIASSSLAKYKNKKKSISEIGRDLGAGTLLEGSVRKNGAKVRVTAKLTDTESRRILWSESFEKKADDIIFIQAAIAKSVGTALRVRSALTERTDLTKHYPSRFSAFVKYTKGMHLLRDRKEKDIKLAKNYFESAIALDPSYALPYTGLAEAYNMLGRYADISFPRAHRKAIDAVRQAILIDDELPESRASLGYILATDYRFAEAEEEFKHAIALNPNYAIAHQWYGACLCDLGRWSEGLAEYSLVQEIDPLSLVAPANISIISHLIGLKTEARRQLEIAESVEPGSDFIFFIMAVHSMLEGDFDSAAGHLEAFVKRRPEDIRRYGELGYAYGRAGKIDRARDILHNLAEVSKESEYLSSFPLAKIYCGLNDLDKAFHYLDRAYRERTIEIRDFAYLGMEKIIGNDPRYAALLKRCNIPRRGAGAIVVELKNADTHEGSQVESTSPRERVTSKTARLPNELTRQYRDWRSKIVFEYLLKAFLHDHVGEMMPISVSGWRTLNQISTDTGVSRFVLYDSLNVTKVPILEELRESNSIETKIFTGERGRGARVAKLRIAYESNGKIREIVALIMKEKSRVTEWL